MKKSRPKSRSKWSLRRQKRRLRLISRIVFGFGTMSFAISVLYQESPTDWLTNLVQYLRPSLIAQDTIWEGKQWLSQPKGFFPEETNLYRGRKTI